ncbi:MAG: methyltransferase family protein [Candidatus Binatia bacterium]
MLFLRILIFTVLVPGTVTVAVPYVLQHSDLAFQLAVPGTLRLVGVLSVGLGVAIYLWCAWNFGAAGKGTPAPYDPPRLLVTRGLYRWVRNPIYVGIVLIILGEGLVFDAGILLLYSALLLLLFHLRVVVYEEPHLQAKFGANYDDYCKAVPRWLPSTRARKR